MVKKIVFTCMIEESSEDILKTLTKLFLLVALSFGIIFGSVATLANEDTKPELNCSSYDAVYEPHRSYTSIEQKIYLRIEKPKKNESAGPSRLAFFHFYRGEENNIISSLRLSYTCTGGASICYANGYWGQYNPTNQLKRYDSQVNLEVIPLNSQLFPVDLLSTQQAPKLILFPNIGAKFYYAKNYGEPFEAYTRVFKKSKKRPEIENHEAWIFVNCINFEE
jgi:hypothetical protein